MTSDQKEKKETRDEIQLIKMSQMLDPGQGPGNITIFQGNYIYKLHSWWGVMTVELLFQKELLRANTKWRILGLF